MTDEHGQAIVMEDANKEDAVMVAVTRDGKIFLGGDQIQVDVMGPTISSRLEKNPDKTVYLRADNRAPYGKVMDAIDAIRTAGVEQLGLLTDKKQ